MADDEIMAVDKRRASLEVTVAEGFFEQGKKLDRLDASFESLGSDSHSFSSGSTACASLWNAREKRTGAIAQPTVAK